jgi:uncharacterized membrane protein SpoIIM required for sporulation/uncharacterized RDD family membrane protein YckC
MVQRPPAFERRQHLEVETPENVVLDYEIAGIGSRTLAALADWLILAVLGGALSIASGVWRDAAPWLVAVLVLILYSVVWGYFTCFEGLRRGQTPGKRWLGIRVIRDTGHAVSFSDAAARNLLLPVDLFLLVGVFFIAIHPRAKRIGDLVAGTVVVRDHPVEVRASPASPGAAKTGLPDGSGAASLSGSPLLADDEFRLLREFSQRAASLPPAVQHRLAGNLAARFGERFPERPQDDGTFLEELYQDELARRRGRFGVRSREKSGVADRLVARKSVRWDEFQKLADQVAGGGLDALSAGELPEFAARYREISADLARARTYGADSLTLARLTRLVAAGHNALYREERQTWGRIWEFFVRECPAAIVRARRYVLLATLVFVLPALVGFALLRDRPSLAPLVLPDVLLERAEAGAGRQAQGSGYVEALSGDRPLVASMIITNNIRVAFMCFAGGIALGVGSLLLLALNGLSIGAASGHFANAGLLGYLWTFVIGHGLLELFAIWVAGAAGFMLGKALILPGELPRRDAVVLAGRLAMRLLGAVVVFLLVAGGIEGFVSAGTSSLPVRLAMSVGSVVFLALYLWNGVRMSRAEQGER